MYEPTEPESGNHNSGFESGIPSHSSGIKPGVTKSQPDRKCSYCGKSFFSGDSKNLPFCSRRCQQIDLGMWLNESYGLPFEGEGTPDLTDPYEDENL
ncbi:MAG: DNA gyrase inhibitor YacG [Planctomycetota bacterium]